MAEASAIVGKTSKCVAVLLLCLGWWSPARLGADDIVVAAASDLSFAIREIIEDFERDTPHRVRLSMGSSGNFFAQIQNGAPFDVYLSADIDYPRQLSVAGLSEPGSLFSYAFGRIVVWTRNDSSSELALTAMTALLEEGGPIAIANPRHAPYGRAAQFALEYYDLWDDVSSRLVLAENVSQAAQFAESGSAGIAIIALSLASSDPLRRAGRFWEIPQAAHPELAQGGVILPHARSTGRLEGARTFVAWMQGDRARAILARYGFSLPAN